MKGLLQSKKFKQNLKKWLFMYVGALLILTSVVTYSKYLSKFNTGDEARVTKFNVSIVNDTVATKDNTNAGFDCKIEDGKIVCDTGNYRPTSTISYNFTVNTNLEVNTLLIVSVFVPKDFKVIELKDDAGNKYTPSETDNNITEDGYRLIEIQKNISANSSEAHASKKYSLTIKYDYHDPIDDKNVSTNDSNKNNSSDDNKKNIKIGYSATQIKN